MQAVYASHRERQQADYSIVALKLVPLFNRFLIDWDLSDVKSVSQEVKLYTLHPAHWPTDPRFSLADYLAPLSQ